MKRFCHSKSGTFHKNRIRVPEPLICPLCRLFVLFILAFVREECNNSKETSFALVDKRGFFDGGGGEILNSVFARTLI
jgi:hypothetical protein